MGHEQATSATSTCKKSGKNFRWEEKHVEDLINWQTVDVKIFGPVNVTDFNENTKSNVDQNKNIETIWKEEKELMIRSRNRIIEKVKDIRQSFSKAVTTGTRSGSGKIVYEFCDKLVKTSWIWNSKRWLC